VAKRPLLGCWSVSPGLLGRTAAGMGLESRLVRCDLSQ
jgi:hypothetical protein